MGPQADGVQVRADGVHPLGGTTSAQRAVVAGGLPFNLSLKVHNHPVHLSVQAEKFRSKAQKTEVFRSYQQYCRYLYYVGRIRTIQLEYTDAKESLQQVSNVSIDGFDLLRLSPILLSFQPGSHIYVFTLRRSARLPRLPSASA